MIEEEWKKEAAALIAQRDARVTRDVRTETAARRDRAATLADLDALCEGVTKACAKGTKTYVNEQMELLRWRIVQLENKLGESPPEDLKAWFDPLIDRIEELETRLEQKGLGVRYTGVWQKAQQYQRGDLVTFEGSMWHCNGTTRSMPGVDTDWQLAVKAGRDAR